MTKEKILSVLSLLASITLVAVFVYYRETEEAKGSAFPGSAARVATTSQLSLQSDVVVPIFGAQLSPGMGGWNAYATSSSCTSRIISTQGVPISLQFRDGASSTPTYGHIQAASTTEVYDAEVYGCGRYTALPIDSGTAGTIISVTELTQ